MLGQAKPPALTVLYDGACPLCQREIGIYRDCRTLSPVEYTDVSALECPIPAGRTREELLARFHVLKPDGQYLDGAAAFVELWAALPGWRWLARLGKVPGVIASLNWLYDRFLPLRPRLQRLMQRRVA